MFLEVWNYVRPVCESTAVEIVLLHHYEYTTSDMVLGL